MCNSLEGTVRKDAQVEGEKRQLSQGFGGHVADLSHVE